MELFFTAPPVTVITESLKIGTYIHWGHYVHVFVFARIEVKLRYFEMAIKYYVLLVFKTLFMKDSIPLYRAQAGLRPLLEISIKYVI